MPLIRRLTLATVALVAATALSAPPASAGGGEWLIPVLDRYSPGETATLVAYTAPGNEGWVDDGPYQAFLRVDRDEQPPPGQEYLRPGEASSDIPLGPLVLQETGRGGNLSLRVAITFTVPDLAPDGYDVMYANDDGTWLGQVVGGYLPIDVDSPEGWPLAWPADDPARAGAAADVPLPPAPPTTAPAPTTVPPTTAATTAPSTERTRPAPSTVVVTQEVVRAVAGADGPDGDIHPGWIVLGLSASAVALALAAAARSRRSTGGPQVGGG